MPEYRTANLVLLSFVGISLSGMAMVLFITSYVPRIVEDVPWRKTAIGSVFAALCLLGAVAALFPKSCSWRFALSKSHGSGEAYAQAARGHHADCGHFAAHVLRLRHHVACAACSGLFLGAVVAAIGSSLHFSGLLLISGFATFLVWLGASLVTLGMAQFLFRGVFRFLVNTFFVLGAFLMLVGADELVQSFFLDLFVFGVIIFWIITRILLSDWDHTRICRGCESQCVADKKRRG